MMLYVLLSSDIIPHLHNLFLFQFDVIRSLNRLIRAFSVPKPAPFPIFDISCCWLGSEELL